MTALITGGAGFIGSNLAHRLLAQGEPVIILDNLSRAGVEKNVDWLRRSFGSGLEFVLGDVRDAAVVQAAVRRADVVFHFAAQVAVTTSLVQPTLDFEVNAGGTLCVLEAIRRSPSQPPVFFTSTNKVYGSLANLELEELANAYLPSNPDVRRLGVSEKQTLDFQSPYGCSKGVADQYVLDYARSFGLRGVVFRMSCMYGPRQFGTEDQGWVAHFVLRALRGEKITIYGDGKQVRDLLYIDNLVDAFLLGRQYLDRCAGNAFNIGGGPENAISVGDLLNRIGQLIRRRISVSYDQWRGGDQRYYVSDSRAFQACTGWRSRTSLVQGLQHLAYWLGELERRPVVEAAASSAEVLP